MQGAQSAIGWQLVDRRSLPLGPLVACSVATLRSFLPDEVRRRLDLKARSCITGIIHRTQSAHLSHNLALVIAKQLVLPELLFECYNLAINLGRHPFNNHIYRVARLRFIFITEGTEPSRSRFVLFVIVIVVVHLIVCLVACDFLC